MAGCNTNRRQVLVSFKEQTKVFVDKWTIISVKFGEILIQATNCCTEKNGNWEDIKIQLDDLYNKIDECCGNLSDGLDWIITVLPCWCDKPRPVRTTTEPPVTTEEPITTEEPVTTTTTFPCDLEIEIIEPQPLTTTTTEESTTTTTVCDRFFPCGIYRIVNDTDEVRDFIYRDCGETEWFGGVSVNAHSSTYLFSCKELYTEDCYLEFILLEACTTTSTTSSTSTTTEPPGCQSFWGEGEITITEKNAGDPKSGLVYIFGNIQITLPSIIFDFSTPFRSYTDYQYWNGDYFVWFKVGGIWSVPYRYSYNSNAVGTMDIPSGHFNANSNDVMSTDTVQISFTDADSNDLEVLLKSLGINDEIFISDCEGADPTVTTTTSSSTTEEPITTEEPVTTEEPGECDIECEVYWNENNWYLSASLPAIANKEYYVNVHWYYSEDGNPPYTEEEYIVTVQFNHQVGNVIIPAINNPQIVIVCWVEGITPCDEFYYSRGCCFTTTTTEELL